MRSARELALVWALAAAAVCGAGMGAELSEGHGYYFFLESMPARVRYGPFKMIQDARIMLGDQVYAVHILNATEFEVVSLETAVRDGPYEFKLGRIILINGKAYALFGISRERPASTNAAPASVSGRIPLPPPALPPAATNPIAGVAAALPPPAVPARPRAPGVRTESPARGWGAGRAYVGGRFTFGHVGSYELRAGDSGAASDLEIDRTEWSVVAGRGIVRGRLSWVSAAEWNRSGVRTDRAVVESVEADSDGGFELAVEVERMFVRRGPWAAGAYGEAAYRRENYSLSYGESLVREVVVVDTNGVPGVETVNELRPREERWTLTETTVRAGGVVSYSDRGWTGYARLGADLLSDAGSSGALVQGERRVALEPRRKQNVFVAAGADLRLESGLNFFAEIETLGSEARRFGISYEF